MSNEIILVLGMHRSATSLTANIIVELGLYAGNKNELAEADLYNKKGYFERKDVVELSYKMIIENGMTWSSVRGQIKKIKISKDTQTELETILRSLLKNASGRSIVIKEPKICITEPVWRETFKALKLKERIVVVFRHPYEVAMSIKKRDDINFSHALKMWYYHNCCILNILCSINYEDYIIINHNDYFYKSELQIDKIAKFLHIYTYSDDNIKNIIDLKLYHNKINNSFGEKSKLEYMSNELYNYMVSLSNETKKLDINEVERYIYYLDELDSSFEKNKMDIKLNLVEEGNYCETKEWCYYILENYKDILRKYLREYFEKNNIKSISLYGNGTVAYKLFPILVENDIKINKIYDKVNYEPVNYGSNRIEICNLENMVKNPEEIVINTAVNKHKEVLDILCKYFERDNIISLFKILYEVIIENK